MINKKLPMSVLANVQKFSKQGLITEEERTKISEACKLYTRTGDDDEFYDFLSWASENLSNQVVRKKINSIKEDYYDDNSHNNSDGLNDN